MALAAPRLDTPLGRPGVAPIRRHFALAGLTAVLLALAFPRPGLGILAHVALVPILLLALRSQGAWRLLWTSYLVNLVWWLVMIRWMYPVTVGGTIGLSAYMAIYLPLFALMVRFLSHRFPAGMVVAAPMLWVSLEFIRCEWLEGGFAWFALAHTQMPFPAPGQRALASTGRLIQVADLFSQYGVSFLVAMTNGLIVDLLTRRLVRRDELTGHARPGRTALAGMLIWILAIGGSLTYGHFRLHRDLSASPVIHVAAVQTNVPQTNRNNPTAATLLQDWIRLQELTRAAAGLADLTPAADAPLAPPGAAPAASSPAPARPRPDVIVWPEGASPAALNPEALDYYATAQTGARGRQVVHQQIADLAREVRAALIVGGGAYYDWRVITAPEGGQFEVPTRRYNSAFLYRPDGRPSDLRYDKIHLVPFGEYIPWIKALPALRDFFFHYISPYDFDYTLSRGTSYPVFITPLPRAAEVASAAPALPAELRIGTPICFEDVYPDTVRRLVFTPNGRKRADILANITNDGWFLFEYDEPWMSTWYGRSVGWLAGWIGTSYQAEQEFQSAAIRCIETRTPMVRSVNTGISGFIDSAGRIGPVTLDPLGRHKGFEDVVHASVRLDPHGTLFGALGYAPCYTLILATGLWLLAGLFRTGKMRTHMGVHA